MIVREAWLSYVMGLCKQIGEPDVPEDIGCQALSEADVEISAFLSKVGTPEEGT